MSSSPPRPDTGDDEITEVWSNESPKLSQDPASSGETVSPAATPLQDPESSPFTDPVSSPLEDDPVSSPFKEQVSSPYKEPVSSPFNEEPISSSGDLTSSPHLDIQQQTSLMASFSDDESRPPECKRAKCDEPVSEISSSHLLPTKVTAGSRITTHEETSASENQCVEPTAGTSCDITTIDLSPHGAGTSQCLHENWTQDHNFGGLDNAAIGSEDRVHSEVNTSAFDRHEDSSSSCSDSSSSSDLFGSELSSDSESPSNSNSLLSNDSLNGTSVESSSLLSSPKSSEPNSDIEKDSDDSDSDDSDSDSSSSGDGPLQVKKVFQQSNLSLDEGVLSLMNLFMKRKLEKSLMGDILKVVLQFLPNDHTMPKSQHLLFKYVKDLCPLSPPKLHFYCQECHFYVGEENAPCPLCGSECNKFVQLSLADQVRNLFEVHNLADLIDKFDLSQKNNAAEGKYSSICDGSEFKRAWCGAQYDLVLHMYTDGVSLSDRSEVQFYPLEFIICQLPFNLRIRFVLICGIWVDKCKPPMNTFLKPFVNELKELYKNGVKWTHPQSKVEFTSRVSAPGFCGDAPVRAQVQNISQHGGRFSCNMCEQKMVVCTCLETQEKKRVFSMKEDETRLRTEERMKKQAKKTKEMKKGGGKNVKPCKGVRGRSMLSKIPTCDRSKAVYPEYMHLLLGIIKLFMKLWFKTSGKDEWSLKAHQDDINSSLESIKVPDHMRAARSADHYPKWKASECRSFLLFYSLPVLSPFMKQQYLQHWLLFVCAMYILLQDSIMEREIKKAEILLRLFLKEFAKLYRAEDFTYNLHNLCHLALTTRLYGPLSESSAFMFESINGDLRNCIHGTKNLVMELTNTLNLFQGIQVLKARVEAKNICADTLIDRDSVELRSMIKKNRIVDDIRRMISYFNLKSPYFLRPYRPAFSISHSNEMS